MGLIKSAIGAIGGTLHDQWKDVISCENMENDILMKKITTDSGIISKNSIIRVMPGQCAIIVQNGKVLDGSAEEGDYTFNESTTPSFFGGDFGEVFKEMWKRFSFGGVASDSQAVYFFNTKEIIDNKFGTATPIPFQDWSHPVPNQMTGGIIPLAVKVKCYGKFSFKISDPSKFMNEIAGTADIYKKEQVIEQLRTEIISTFQNILNELGTEKYKVPVLELPSQTDEIKEMMDERVYDKSLRDRGLTIITFLIESVSLDEKSEDYINNYILSANDKMQQGTLTGAYAEAVKNAANNSNGSANGFMGIGMMNMASGGAFGAVTNNQNSTSKDNENSNVQNNSSMKETKEWICPNCGKENKGKFCLRCGTPNNKEKRCPKCGEPIQEEAAFCPECGEKLT